MGEQYDNMMQWLSAELQPDAPGPSKPGVRRTTLPSTYNLCILHCLCLVLTHFASDRQISSWRGVTDHASQRRRHGHIDR